MKTPKKAALAAARVVVQATRACRKKRYECGRSHGGKGEG